MNKFCIITNQDKDIEYQITNHIFEYLEARGKQCFLAESQIDQYENYYTDCSVIPEGTECAIVLGGDGTLIQAASDLLDYQIPILGINLGTLGFLAEIELQNLDEALEHLLLGEFQLEHRLMLEGVINNHEQQYHTGVALNDIVITRSGFSRIITVEVLVNNEKAIKYRGDGVIISTPTGSTGYNLSAGGPVIKHDTKTIVITPICPHSLNARSIIISDTDTVKVRIGKSKKTQSEEAIATFDGRTAIKLQQEDVVVIHKAEKDTSLIKVSQNGFFHVLRTKIGEDGE